MNAMGCKKYPSILGTHNNIRFFAAILSTKSPLIPSCVLQRACVVNIKTWIFYEKLSI